MANIKITVDGPLMDGHKITFKAPCDCTEVQYLDVLYVKDGAQVNKLFTMKDTHGNTLTGVGNLFKTEAYVHVILDITRNYAYLQNADTNAYLEGKFAEMSSALEGNFVVLTGSKNIKDGETVDVTLSLPSGFTFDNSMIVSATTYQYTVNVEHNNLSVKMNGGNVNTLTFQLQGAASTSLGSSYKYYKILLYRYA